MDPGWTADPPSNRSERHWWQLALVALVTLMGPSRLPILHQNTLSGIDANALTGLKLLVSNSGE